MSVRSSPDDRALGGYGGSFLETRSAIGSTTTLIPYGGTFSGFIPYRMAGERGLTFEPRERRNMDAIRTPFRLSPSLIGRDLGASSPLLPPRNPSTRGMGGVMPPNFGSPFRRPPSLIGPATSGTGASM